MIKVIRILLLAVLATVGLAACSSASVESGAAQDAPAVGLPEGRPAFLISHADW